MARKKQQRQLIQGWAVYLRTSTDESQAPERSQESQRRIINRVFLKDSDLPVIGEYRDTYTGRKTDRENYQRMLEDARQGKFSFVAVAMIDRFGRNNGEIGRAIDELIDLGIKIRLANFPDLDVTNAGGRLIVNLLAAVAHFESDNNGERTIEGMLTKILEGGWSFRAPDGYLNVEERVGNKDIDNGRYRRWVVQDPQQAKVWRLAWDLLLEDQLSLAKICEELHQRGYRRRSGASFVNIDPTGYRDPNTGALSSAFHNWFYAGWVVVDNRWATILPKNIKGRWEPIVTTEEFERGLAILDRRNRNRDQKSKNFYLLTSLVYLDNGSKEIRMTGSTPSSSRPGGGTPYYHAADQKSVNIPCRIVDANLRNQLHAIQIQEKFLPDLRAAYTQHVEAHLEEKADDRTALQAALKRIDEEEERTARLFASGRISESIWDTLWAEWNDQRARIRQSIESLGAKKEAHLDNLESAINLLAKLGILYDRLAQQERKFLLKQIVKKIVINLEGMIVKVEFYPPFSYLNELASCYGNNGRGFSVENEKSSSGLDCSKLSLLGVPSRTRTCASGSGGQRSIH